MIERAEVKSRNIRGLSRAEMPIFLVGMRGSGKTTVGEQLATQTGRRFIDLDKLLVERVGKRIPEIIEQYNWGYFRDRESEVLRAVSSIPRTVIATGGGVILRPSNIEALRQGVTAYLDTPVQNLCSRIGDDPNRPPLTDKGTLEEELTTVFNQRSGLYKYASDMAFGTENQTPESLTHTIYQYLRRDRYV